MHLKCFIGKHVWKIYKASTIDYQAKVCQKCKLVKFYDTILDIDFVVYSSKDDDITTYHMLREILLAMEKEKRK